MLGPNYNVYWHVVVLIRLLGEVNYAYTASQIGSFRFYAARCFQLALEAIKWLSEIHQSSEKCMYFWTWLFVPSLKVLLERC